MRSHSEQVEYGEKRIAAAGRWAEKKGFNFEKTQYAKIFAAATAAVQDDEPNIFTFDEMKELLDVLAKVD